MIEFKIYLFFIIFLVLSLTSNKVETANHHRHDLNAMKNKPTIDTNSMVHTNKTEQSIHKPKSQPKSNDDNSVSHYMDILHRAVVSIGGFSESEHNNQTDENENKAIIFERIIVINKPKSFESPQFDIIELPSIDNDQDNEPSHPDIIHASNSNSTNKTKNPNNLSNIVKHLDTQNGPRNNANNILAKPKSLTDRHTSTNAHKSDHPVIKPSSKAVQNSKSQQSPSLIKNNPYQSASTHNGPSSTLYKSSSSVQPKPASSNQQSNPTYSPQSLMAMLNALDVKDNTDANMILPRTSGFTSGLTKEQMQAYNEYLRRQQQLERQLQMQQRRMYQQNRPNANSIYSSQLFN